ncbi:acylphosphatase [Arthrobacter castelli]|uniref:acylphosphatase n=1 Tax=Arthrobacter castelli TaxID=271431 RepID=UPI00047C1A1F|nr:acylphosphatase [Arthrobacter castelli]
MSETRLTATVTGQVQAVGFRYWVRRQAERLGVTGTAVNEPDGSVTVIAEGDPDATARLLEALRSGRTPGHVSHVDAEYSQARGDYSRFREG